MTKRIILLGAPGSGKKTHAKNICEWFGCEHLQVGNVIKEAIKIGSPAGKKAKSFLKAKKFIPDDLLTKLMTEKISTCPDHFLLDGFPQNQSQADKLLDFLKDNDSKVTDCIYLDVPAALLKRRNCNFARGNRNKEILGARLKFFDDSVSVMEYFNEKNQLQTISALKKVEFVWQKILDVLKRNSKSDRKFSAEDIHESVAALSERFSLNIDGEHEDSASFDKNRRRSSKKNIDGKHFGQKKRQSYKGIINKQPKKHV